VKEVIKDLESNLQTAKRELQFVEEAYQEAYANFTKRKIKWEDKISQLESALELLREAPTKKENGKE
jgi:hypothetical protein